MPSDEFRQGESTTEGGRVAGKDEDGNEVDFRITEIRDKIAYLDGNHPLPGQTLPFEVEIREIRDASEEKIRCGLGGPWIPLDRPF